MKTLLKGGPNDGQIVNTTRNQFALSFVTERYKRRPGKPDKRIGYKEVLYRDSWKRERHPCKKKGLVRVYVFCKRSLVHRPNLAKKGSAPS